MVRRSRALLVAVGFGALSLSACTTSLRAPEVLVFASPQRELVAEPANVKPGEVLVRLENRSSVDTTFALASLDPGVARLPTTGGVVPMGDPADLTFRGSGYRILAKGEELRREISGRGVSKQVLHPHLRRGTLVVFDTARGRYDAGAFVTIEVTTR